ncbi:MAG: tRNA 4-thiouridine(8) synthase ThiI [Defluviitaleaceae bacterium]|nr:tRNA 4-thiouridine(8) synthase ThiI [Defluviitaleaceae bacterium]MCL2263387.1 tRNA 4-thiouridine(8) synthase ThiI [Defluviitaleaceae bacterium]
MKTVLLVKYGEISLRKGNRAFFEHRLLDAIRHNLKGLGGIRVMREQGRFLVESVEGDLDVGAVLPRIRHIFGIAGFCHAVKTGERDIKGLCAVGVEFFVKQLNTLNGVKHGTFRVETKRSDKNYPMTSTAISAAIGEAVLDAGVELAVDLYKPDITLWVEIRNDVYFYVNSESGEGGLPYGASGKGVLLLSGGFDSPVAGYLTARRGVEIVAVYFHSPPFVSERAQDKVMDLTRQLAKYTGGATLCVVPFTDIQVFLKENVSEVKLTIFLKRAMLHIASRLAEKEKALCLVTGDSIGQVASQTIHSLAAMETAAAFPVLRPLAAMDKQSIIDIAKKIGTYDISVRPYEDCCTVFVAKHPENKPNKAAIEKIETRFADELAAMVDTALNAAEFHKV